MATPNLVLPTLPSGATITSAAFNDAMQLIDALMPLIVQDKDLNTPPVTVSGDAGKRWIVGLAPTGAWAGKTGQVALSTGATLWLFFPPKEGWMARVLDEDDSYYFHDGTEWVSGFRVAGPLISGPASGSVSPTPTTRIATQTQIRRWRWRYNATDAADGDMSFDKWDGAAWIVKMIMNMTTDVMKFVAAISVSNSAATISAGTGTPEGVVTAVVGSLYTRLDGSTLTTLYVKTSGVGNTGWTAK